MPWSFPVDTFFPVWHIPQPEHGPQPQKQHSGRPLESLASALLALICFEVVSAEGIRWSDIAAALFQDVASRNLSVSRQMEKLSIEQYFEQKNLLSASAFDEWREAQHFQVLC